MNQSSLTKITLEGYKSFRKLELELRPLNVLIGANGVGKSNFVSFFRLIGEIVSGRLQLAVGHAGGADIFLRYGRKTKYIVARIEFRTVLYDFKLRSNSSDSLIFQTEDVYQLLNGVAESLVIGEISRASGGRESVLWDANQHPDDYDEEIEAIRDIQSSLEGIRIHHFHDTSSTAVIKGLGRLNDNIELRSDGENLAAILFKIRTQNLKAYQTIRDVIRSVAPYFDDFLLRPNPLNIDTIRLEWREHDSDYPFLARDLSDGTLRFMALTTLLLQPEPPAIIVIDEPELGLHPFAIEKLAGLLKIASSRAQLIVATQSPQLIAALEPEDIIVADRKDGETTMQRLDAANLEGWLEEYTLGELWQKNILGGVVNPNTVRSRSNS